MTDEAAPSEEADKPWCFVIAPIGEPNSDTRMRSDLVRDYIIAPALDQLGYQPPKRAEAIATPGTITTHIVEYLRDAPLVIADLTGHNPNVFYELGIRHLFGGPTVPIIDAHERPPFDVSALRAILVDHRNRGALEKGRDDLIASIQEMKGPHGLSDNPVSRALGFDLKDFTATAQALNAVKAMLRSITKLVETLDATEKAEPGRIDKKLEEAITEISPAARAYGRGQFGLPTVTISGTGTVTDPPTFGGGSAGPVTRIDPTRFNPFGAANTSPEDVARQKKHPE